MDPNQWRNYNIPYGQPPGTTLTSSTARFDLLNEQGGFNTGFGIPSNLSGLQGVASHYSSVNTSSLGSTNKPQPSQFPLESGNVRSPESGLPFRLPPLSELERSKLLFHQNSIKAENFPEQSGGNRLQNYLSSNQYGTELDSPIDPPPAHSGSSSRSAIQRNPVIPDDIYHSVPGKGPTGALKISVPSTKMNYSEMRSPTSSLLYGISNPGIEDLTTSQSSSSYSPYTSSTKTESTFHTTQVSNYDPVSPVSDSNDHFSNINLQEFGQHNQMNDPVDRSLNSNHLMMQMNYVKSSSLHNIQPEVGGMIQKDISNAFVPKTDGQMIRKSPSMQNTPSPLQQSPHSSSPLVQMQKDSPQSQISSSTMAAIPPVQAVPDSTTKPKKPRGRKKKNSGQSFSANENYNFSPQNKQTHSPQANQSYSPQSFSPQVQQQFHGNFSSNIQQAIPSGSTMNNNGSPMMSDFNSGQADLRNPHMADHDQPPHNINQINMSSNQSLPQRGMQSSHQNLNLRHPSLDTPQNAIQSPLSDMQGRQQSMQMTRSSLDEPPNNMHINSVQNQIQMDNKSNSSYGHGSESMLNTDVNKSALRDPLGMPMGIMEGGNYHMSPQENPLYTDLDSYSRFESGGQSMNYSDSNRLHRTTSTIDEDALSSLIGGHPMPPQPTPSVSYVREQSPPEWAPASDSYPEKCVPPPAVSTQPEQDEEFAHLQKPPTAAPKEKQVIILNSAPKDQPPAPNPPPPSRPKPEIKKNANSGFLDSFLSFIQGKKPETLSSVNSSVVKRPELPKYIPEPPRPKAVPRKEWKVSSDSASPRPDTEGSSHASPSTSQASTLFSDEDESNSSVKVQNIVSHIVEDGKPSLKLKISLGKSKAKNTVISTSSETKVTKRRTSKGSARSKKKKNVDNDSDEAFVLSSGDESKTKGEAVKEQSPPPALPTRQLSSRKAKEKAQQRKKYFESDSDDDELGPIKPFSKKAADSDEAYDSDRDPEWAPFAEENKKESRVRTPRGRSKRRSTHQRYTESDSDEAPTVRNKKAKVATVPVQPVKVPTVSVQPVKVENIYTKTESLAPSDSKPGFRIGEFIISRNDLDKFESFPIWRIDIGKMVRKYELFTDKGKIRHKATCTFSSYMPNMENDYMPIRVKVVTHHKDGDIVEVYEEDKPKPKLDSSLENAYEEDPLAEMFNIYLQIFLSHALETSFLSAILESKEEFYTGPLKTIDDVIDKRLIEIDAKVQWKNEFKKALQTKPHIRELDRPHLKAVCQACQYSSEPAIKSVHLFGQSYNRTTLEEVRMTPAEGASVEFFIGQTASCHVKPYHNLYHFKYNLSKRCLAKVDIVRQGNNALDNSEILDRCLNNRTWVLKIFDDLKNLLEKG